MNDPQAPITLLRAVDVAERLQISMSLAYRMMSAGEIPVVRLRSAVRVRADVLQQIIEAGGTGAPAKAER